MEIRYKSLDDSTYVPLWRPFFNQDKGSRAKLSTHKPQYAFLFEGGTVI